MGIDFQLTVCSHRHVTADTAGCIERFRLRTRLVHFLAIYSGDALIARARSLALTRFIEMSDVKIPYLIFLDDDILFMPEDIEKLVGDMQDGYDIIGGAYTVRDGSQLASYGWEGRIPIDGKIHEIEYLATGFMGISRKAVLKIKDGLKLPLLNEGEIMHCYPFMESKRSEGRDKPIYLSEDWDFCEKARQVGLKVYLDTAVRVGHLGLHAFTVDEMIYKKKAEEEGEAVKLS